MKPSTDNAFALRLGHRACTQGGAPDASSELPRVELVDRHAAQDLRADDGAGGSPDDGVGTGEVDAGRMQPGEYADLPGSPGDAASAKDQGRSGHLAAMLVRPVVADRIGLVNSQT